MLPVLFTGLSWALWLSCAQDFPRRPHVIVLVTLDTLRADHLGVYGYPRKTSPFLDELAARSAVFDNAFASSATTGPAHASLFTGEPPLRHRVRSNHQRLDPALPTLAEWMGRVGYETAAFVGISTHFVQSGLDRGFQTFDRPRSAAVAEIRSASDTSAVVDSWLRGREADPLFLWVHYFDPHTPYRSPLPPTTSKDHAQHARFLRDQQHVPLELFGGDEANLLALIDAYDAEVSALDAGLRDLHAAIERAYPNERKLWVITSDHGEGLGNHHWPLHGSRIYNEQLRTVLIVHDSAGSFAGLRVKELASDVDLLPTLLEIAGREITSAEGASQPRSLVPLLRAQRDSRRRVVFSERRAFKPRSSGTAPSTPPTLEAPVPFSVKSLLREAHRRPTEPGEKYALQDGTFKYIHHTIFDDELYRVAEDPYELENLIGEGLPEETELRRELLTLLTELRGTAAETVPIGRESLEALEALGYVE